MGHENMYCSDKWRQNWVSRTVITLQECKAACAADVNCLGITVGTHLGVADNCVLCSGDGLSSADWTTTYLKASSILDTSCCNYDTYTARLDSVDMREASSIMVLPV